MLNIFRKKVISSQNTISIEEQIYNDVYSAQELILAEAKRILAMPKTFDSVKAKRLLELEKLGFGNFDEIKELKKEQQKAKEHSELHAMINYYQKIYPFHRFISQESVQVIIKKYNLLLAWGNDYIAEIPEKNQQEIVAFKVRRKDIRTPKEMDMGWFILESPLIRYWGEESSMFTFHDLMAKQSGDYKKYFKDKKERERQEKLAYERELLPGKDLLIIAPQHKLNMSGKIVEDGILRIKDPIVLQPVIAGYLIVSSWGLEASDELVVNERMN